MVTSLIHPSFNKGFARGSLSKRPNLWKGLAGYWKPSLGVTGNRLIDVSGRGNHGTLTNMDMDDWVISGNPKLPGYVLAFNGSTSYVLTSLVLPGGSNPFTISFWFKTNNVAEAQDVFHQWGNATSKLFRFNIHAIASNGFGLWFRDGDGSSDPITTSPIVANRWYYAIATHDGTDQALYLNNELVGTLSLGALASGQSQTVWLGRTPDVANSLNGFTNGARIHTRVLSASERLDTFQHPNAMFEFADRGTGRTPAVVSLAKSIPWLRRRRRQIL